MKRLALLLLIGLGIDTGSAQGTTGRAEVPPMDGYAWGFQILTREEASFYSVRLPLTVYRSVTDPQLRDAGVYDAAGRPVPRVFEVARDDVDRVERAERLPFVPVYAGERDTGEDEIRLLLERDGEIARLGLSTDASADATDERRLAAYVIDARGLDVAVDAVDLYWTPLETGFIGHVEVHGSDDLSDWRRLGSGAIADMEAENAGILRRRVPLAVSAYDFLKIEWRDVPDEFRLGYIDAVYTLGDSGLDREWTVLEQSGTDPGDGGRIFALGGAPTTDRLRVALRETNTIISADVYRWSDARDEWQRAATGAWYHVGRGDNVVESEAAAVAPTRSSRFKVVPTGGQRDVPLTLEVGWRPDTLLFLAQGRGPYTLAAGRAADAAAGFPQQATYGLRSITSLASDNGEVAVAALGPRTTLGGEDELRLARVIDWRTVSLWLGLLLGVAFVAYMAYRILKETRGS